MRFIKLILFSIFIFFSSHTKAQSANAHRKSLFLSLNLDTELSDRITFSNLIQHREINFTENSKLFLYRPNFQYKLIKNVDIGTGYWYIETHIPVENAYTITRNEHRIWEYIKYTINLNTVELKNRLAFEQRMRSEFESENNELYANQSSYNQRLRYRFNIDFNLFKLRDDKFIKATISEEVRIRFTSGLSDPKFDQNNTYFYLNYDFGAQTNIRLGYGIDYAKISSNVFLVNNALRFRLNYSFDLRKNK